MPSIRPGAGARFRNLSLAQKLTASGIVTTMTALVVAGIVLAIDDVSSARARLARDTGLLAEVVGANSTAAIAFGDGPGASETLHAVRSTRAWWRRCSCWPTGRRSRRTSAPRGRRPTFRRVRPARRRLRTLDVNMPGIDGFQVAEEVRLRPELAGATIMMLSSSGQYGEASRCRDLGVSAYLTKPIQASDLYGAICGVLGGTGADVGRTDAARRPARDVADRPLRILLAEDNVVNQRVAVGLLTRRGHTVSVANNGREAVAAFEQHSFDLVLMDVQMPEMGGFEATAAIRERERTRGTHTPIIAMTAHAMAGDRERCLEAGMDGYLSKPIDPATLYATVEAEASAGAPRPAEAPAVVPDAPAVDRHALVQRLGGDPDLFVEVVRLFLSDCAERLGAIEAAVRDRDDDRIRSEAHALKGAAGNLSAMRLAEAAQALETIGAEGRIDAAPAAWRQLSTEAAAVVELLRHWDDRGAEAAA